MEEEEEEEEEEGENITGEAEGADEVVKKG